MLCLQTEAHKPNDVGEWAVLEGHLPGLPPQKIGILLRDVSRDNLHVRVRPDWWHGLIAEEESEIWSELSEDLTQRAQEIGAADVLDWLENTASHAIQISPRQEVRLTQAEVTLDSLYWQQLGALDATSQVSDPKREQTLVCLPKSETRSCSRKRKRYFQFHSGWAQAAVAATFLLAVTLAGIRSRRTYPFVPGQDSKGYKEIALPSFAGLGYPPVLFNLESGWEFSRPMGHHRQKRRRMSSQRRFHIRIQTIFAEPRMIASSYSAPPSLEFEPEVTEPLFVPVSIPEAPEFRNRHNRFIRVLAVIATPFRLMFISKHTPERRFPSSLRCLKSPVAEAPEVARNSVES
jgi:hypothetical protein